ncbi:FTS and Hook-interacting protein-like [Limulus polyphemus]|uniref:FTS and Hook-interacting protein-like n=1 Tax=Limulus polyphemus TaxID=6850 RepID=A0ABM1TH01_LIMPO|nr:FTS and Hook-interacting protein-like [Limulus polyphemus]XP_022255158.1 FTS and Hook-interacting protein-like [Limulus polyphemus]
MSWFKRDSPLRSSFRRRSSQIPPLQELDTNACFETFKIHWKQAWQIMNIESEPRKADDVTCVVNLLDQMIALLIQEMSSQKKTEINTIGHTDEATFVGPILDYLFLEKILDKIFVWSIKSGEFVNVMKLEQLKMYETLISHCQEYILFHKPFVRPLLQLLAVCGECSPVEVEKRFVVLLNTICVCITQNQNLLGMFFNVNSEPARFLIFSLLIPFVHREGAIGQQARDALLLCMALSGENESVGLYIAEHSNFCPVLATGLSGLYSVLPRKLPVMKGDWFHLTNEDVQEIPEVFIFMNSLEFCNAVVQVAHHVVKAQVVDYLYQGFLEPVIGPALHQTSTEEVIAATAYLQLFLRSITEPTIIKVFLKFIVMSNFEGHQILDTLVKRIESQSTLCTITLALFKTLLDFNCEDFMLELVLKYLIPCTHVMVSQRIRLRDVDVYSQTAEKLLSLVPTCFLTLPTSSLPSNMKHSERLSLGGSLRVKRHRRTTSTSSLASGDFHVNQRSCSGNNGINPMQLYYEEREHHETSYLDYLKEARECVLACTKASLKWTAPYNGLIPPPDASLMNPAKKHQSCTEVSRDSSVPSGQCDEKLIIIDNYYTDLNQTESSHQNGESSTLSHCLNTENIMCNLSSKSTVNGSSRNENEMNMENSIIELNVERSGDHMDNSALFKERHENKGQLSKYELIKIKKNQHLSNLCTFSDFQDNGTKSLLLGNRTKDSCKSSTSSPSSLESFESPDIGPFLNVLLTKLEMMLQNDVYTNLRLTEVLARLALYPQPLLRSFLLNHSLVFQPTVRSLLQVLGSLKPKVEACCTSISNFEELLLKCSKFFFAREERLLNDLVVREYRKETFNQQKDIQRGERRRSFTNFIFRRGSLRGEKERNVAIRPIFESLPATQGHRQAPEKPEGKLECLKMKNAVLCTVLFSEFLKELAAISQEHSVIQADPEFWTMDSMAYDNI